VVGLPGRRQVRLLPRLLLRLQRYLQLQLRLRQRLRQRLQVLRRQVRPVVDWLEEEGRGAGEEEQRLRRLHPPRLQLTRRRLRLLLRLAKQLNRRHLLSRPQLQLGVLQEDGLLAVEGPVVYCVGLFTKHSRMRSLEENRDALKSVFRMSFLFSFSFDLEMCIDER
jgi:hypothetical protein